MRNELATEAPIPSTRSSDTANRGELRHLRIETAENGFSCEASFEAKKPPNQKTGLPPYPDSEVMVFDEIDNLLKYITKMLTDQADYEKSEK